MKTATVKELDKIGMDVVVRNVTPAEVALLVAEHHAKVGRNPVSIIDGTEVEIKVSSMQEINRLYGKYHPKKVKNLYPSPTANLPESFDEAFALGMGTTSPGTKFMEFDASN